MAFTDNLISYWPLTEAADASAVDSHGSNTLSVSGSVKSGTGLVSSTARDFERNAGADQGHLFIADNSSFNLSGSNMTVAVWIKFEQLSVDEGIIGQYDFGGSTNQRSWTIGITGSTNKLYFAVSSDGIAPTSVVADNFGVVITNRWCLVIARYDGANISIQVNGGAENSTAYSSGLHNSMANVTLGCHLNNGAVANRYDGRMGPAMLWSRSLTADERKLLFLHTTGGVYPFPAQSPSVVLIGDTQNLTYTQASTNALYQWIEDYRSVLNLKAAIHLGDHTERGYADGGGTSTFVKHRTGLDIVINNLFVTLVPGNHDLDGDQSGADAPTRTVTEMDDSGNLPMLLITGKNELNEQMPGGGYNQYAYSFFLDLGFTQTDLFITQPFGPTIAQAQWAQAKARQYPTKRVFLVRHDYVLQDTSLGAALISTNPNNYYASEAEAYHVPSDMWANYYQYIPNLVAIWCGHAFINSSSEARTGHLAQTGAYGNDVSAFVVNNQERTGLGSAGDGNGFLMVCEFTSGGATMSGYGTLAAVREFPNVGVSDVFSTSLETGPFPAAAPKMHMRRMRQPCF